MVIATLALSVVLSGCVGGELSCSEHDDQTFVLANSRIRPLPSVFEFFPGCYRGTIDELSVTVQVPGQEPTVLAPTSDMLSSEDGGSISFVMVENKTTGTGAAKGDHVGSQPTWQLHFANWSRVKPVVNPSLRITWDGADPDAVPDRLPPGTYRVRMEHAESRAAVTFACDVAAAENHLHDCRIGP